MRLDAQFDGPLNTVKWGKSYNSMLGSAVLFLASIAFEKGLG